MGGWGAVRRQRKGSCGCSFVSLMASGALALLVAGCGGGGGSTSTPPPVEPTLTITSNSPGGGTVGVAYSYTLAASGGSGTGYTWSLNSGTLPGGLTLNAAGSLTGKPTAVGTSAFSVKVTDSAAHTATASLSIAIAAQGPLSAYEFTGDTSPVHDPSIIRQGSTYYVFVTDAGGQSGFIPIRCSADKVAWTGCGYVFTSLPSWIAKAVPAATGIWAPDISYFNGLYHLYYAVSSFGSQVSAIGLATNTTLDSTDPNYKWVDSGSAVLQSGAGGNFNAIDPNILVDTDGSVWLTYGSFWSGIFQQQIDPATGEIMAGSAVNHLAERASSVANDPIEGSSLVHKGSYYYLFVSWDYCCESVPAQSDYKIVVGRGTSPHGPFVDQTGADMVSGGGTILLQGDGVTWSGPGGQTAYIDPAEGDLITFHALNLTQNGLDYLFVRSLSFDTGWPVIGTTSVSTPSAIGTTTTLAASATTVTVGTSVTLTATVAAASGATPAGTVNFNSGSTLLGTGTLDGSGKAALTLSSLAVGTFPVIASYMGSGTDGASASASLTVTVQAQAAVTTSTAVASSYASRLQGLPVTLYAIVTPASGTTVPTGGVVFLDGTTTLGNGLLDASGRATLNTEKLAAGAHSITARYGGDTSFSGSLSGAFAQTITPVSTASYTNPLAMTDPALGKVTSCPDPAIIKAQSGSVDTWYLYCTGDPHNSSDLVGGALNNRHLISIYSSSDLANWTFVRDAFTALPAWAAPGALAWAPAIKYFNNQYYLYYTVTLTTYTGGQSAIGVGTSATPDGPFTDSGQAVVQPELVPASMDGGGGYRWNFDADEIQDSGGQRYLLFGSFLGGISVRKLSADGLTSDASSETQIAADQRYEGGAWFEHGGYYYLFVSATNCCAGPLTGYGVFVGRASTPMGPYLDQTGASLSAVNVGGTPVLAMNGNSLIGPGGGNSFTDEGGQDYYVYHEVVTDEPYYANSLTTARPAAIDAIDWVNGWPVARGGFGPSDANAPQPLPGSQPGAVASYVSTLQVNDAPDVQIAGLSDEFIGPGVGPQWTSIHAQPNYTVTGGQLTMPTVAFDSTNAMASLPLLAEAAPAGDYMVETRVSLNLPATGSVDYTQAGLFIYGDDVNYLRMDLYANSDTRQVEFIKSETPAGSGYPTWSATDAGAATALSGTLTTWMRIVKRTVDGVDRYTAYSSTNGLTYYRAGTWTHGLGNNPRIALFGGNRAGYVASFDYVHVSTLK